MCVCVCMCVRVCVHRFNKQHQGLRFGMYIFGPVVMRTYHALKQPQEALEVTDICVCVCVCVCVLMHLSYKLMHSYIFLQFYFAHTSSFHLYSMHYSATVFIHTHTLHHTSSLRLPPNRACITPSCLASLTSLCHISWQWICCTRPRGIHRCWRCLTSCKRGV